MPYGYFVAWHSSKSIRSTFLKAHQSHKTNKKRLAMQSPVINSIGLREVLNKDSGEVALVAGALVTPAS